MKTDVNEVYLGDGLYGLYDGFGVKLRAPREHGDHMVYLEPAVLNQFVVWLKGINVLK